MLKERERRRSCFKSLSSTTKRGSEDERTGKRCVFGLFSGFTRGIGTASCHLQRSYNTFSFLFPLFFFVDLGLLSDPSDPEEGGNSSNAGGGHIVSLVELYTPAKQVL